VEQRADGNYTKVTKGTMLTKLNCREYFVGFVRFVLIVLQP
jgi:hypothetical protein